MKRTYILRATSSRSDVDTTRIETPRKRPRRQTSFNTHKGEESDVEIHAKILDMLNDWDSHALIETLSQVKINKYDDVDIISCQNNLLFNSIEYFVFALIKI